MQELKLLCATVTSSISSERGCIPYATAKALHSQHAMKMDCGHTIQTGEAFHVASVFTCDREGSWPLKVLIACFTPKAKQEPHAVTAQPDKEQAAQPATQSPGQSHCACHRQAPSLSLVLTCAGPTVWVGQATVAVSERPDIPIRPLTQSHAPILTRLWMAMVYSLL